MSTETSAIETYRAETRVFEASREFASRARIRSVEEYERLYRESLEQPDAFWRRETAELGFRTPWTSLLDWQLPHARWFDGATLNVSESCLDRQIATGRREKVALLWESEPGETRRITYGDLHAQVVAFAAALRSLGVEKGNRVAIYMGMVPEVVVAMLACARLGAPHTVVFGGFAAESLRDRINDCGAKVVITQDGALRRGAVVPLKATVDEALSAAPSVEKVVVYRRLGDERAPIAMVEGRDLEWSAIVEKADPGAGEPEIVPAEHPLFILYTSGSTGKPKGVLHTSAGYLAGAHVTSKYVFDLQDDDVYWCTADVG
ncbi:MAG TPA: AMP-binding protein, partial [Polyangiaceae bacterium]